MSEFIELFVDFHQIANIQSKLMVGYVDCCLSLFLFLSGVVIVFCFVYLRSVIVDIGGCSLKFFSLGDCMAPAGLSLYLCDKLNLSKKVLDERPIVSFEHYFFSSVSISTIFLFLLFFICFNFRGTFC